MFQNAEDNEIKGKLDDEMATRLFCCEMLQKLLVPDGNSNVSGKITDAVTDLDLLIQVDWCTVVYNKLKEGIESWKNGSRKTMGCIYLLIISILVSFLVLCRDPII